MSIVKGQKPLPAHEDGNLVYKTMVTNLRLRADNEDGIAGDAADMIEKLYQSLELETANKVWLQDCVTKMLKQLIQGLWVDDCGRGVSINDAMLRLKDCIDILAAGGLSHVTQEKN